MTIRKRTVLPQAGNRPDRRGDRCYPGQASGGSEAGWSRSASASSRRLEIPSFS